MIYQKLKILLNLAIRALSSVFIMYVFAVVTVEILNSFHTDVVSHKPSFVLICSKSCLSAADIKPSLFAVAVGIGSVCSLLKGKPN